jgi:hypothetical protein
LLLQALRDFQDGKQPIGLDPRGYRVRSFRCEAPPERTMEDICRERLSVEPAFAAE